jgi:DNA-directed RNA polymerase specialized sigma24 family protein
LPALRSTLESLRKPEKGLLRDREDMSEAEVAPALGISHGTVKSTGPRAAAKLRIDAEPLKR